MSSEGVIIDVRQRTTPRIEYAKILVLTSRNFSPNIQHGLSRSWSCWTMIVCPRQPKARPVRMMGLSGRSKLQRDGLRECEFCEQIR